MATAEIAIYIGLAGAIHGLFRQSAHTEQLLSQIVKPLLKARAHDPYLSYPNRPVM
jgi:hypothetical protein